MFTRVVGVVLSTWQDRLAGLPLSAGVIIDVTSGREVGRLDGISV